MWSAALGLAPSKDVFWSNSSESYCKGPLHLKDCLKSKYSHASEPHPEVQAAVALLSAGPVGPGDKIGAANKSLLMQTCRDDGLLLKPSYPATALDLVLHERASGKRDRHSGGEINVAYSNISGRVFATIIAIDLPRDVTLTAADLGFGSTGTVLISHEREGGVQGAHSDGGHGITLKKCGKANFRLVWVSPMPTNGEAVLLGEVGKFVPHSPMRWSYMGHLGDGATQVQVRQGDREIFQMAWFIPKTGKVVTAECRPDSHTIGHGAQEEAEAVEPVMKLWGAVEAPREEFQTALITSDGEATCGS